VHFDIKGSDSVSNELKDTTHKKTEHLIAWVTYLKQLNNTLTDTAILYPARHSHNIIH